MIPTLRRLLALLPWLVLGACGSVSPVSVWLPSAREGGEDPAVKEQRLRADKLSIQLADAYRRNNLLIEENRRSEAALRESQKKLDELQQKLEALREIDRDTRRQPKR